MEDFDVNGVGQGNTTYNENDTENHGDSDYREGTGVDLYKKATGVIVGYNQAGEWLEYTVKVASTGTYTMNAAVASANNTSSFQLSVDGKNITEEIAVPAATTGEDNYDEYNVVKADVELTEGEHILRFTVTGDWMDIDYIDFCEKDKCEGTTSLRQKVDFARNSAEPLKVFSMTGKFLGSVVMTGTAREMSEGLKAAGYAQGMYLVRSASKSFRVQVK